MLSDPLVRGTTCKQKKESTKYKAIKVKSNETLYLPPPPNNIQNSSDTRQKSHEKHTHVTKICN